MYFMFQEWTTVRHFRFFGYFDISFHLNDTDDEIESN